MIDYESILKENPNGVLATQNGKGVQTRVVQYLFSEDNKVYFCTSSEKPLYEQLQVNPGVSFCTYPQNFSQVLSVNGSVVFVDETSLKTRVLDENPQIKGIYKLPENPVFKMFYIDVEEVVTFNHSEGQKIYKF
ncbi:MAG: pyridoxamine 5'-phosphate oxidase family protein [Clostridioides sp.]|jgi:uncharacterized pyridoxamine 5'-phosphate oxidase family protein|nr:pyridoxamine 5'-phosphate oxidase family protein [Clostridioides sp.]